MKPLYIWAGGKNKMIPKYQATPGIPYDGYNTYVEPFFGGGAMMVHVYKNNPNIKQFVINDVNTEIIGIYNAIKSNPKAFIKSMDILEKQYLRLDKASRKKYFYDLRTEYTTNWSQWDHVTESATLYFLMKTGFNGIWQTNLSSNGRFATPCGLLTQTTNVYDKHNVMAWHDFLQRVEIYSGDWQACVKAVAGEKIFFFMDPPYRDSFTSYGQVFGDAQQLACVDFCKTADEQGHLVMFCNRDAGDSFFQDNRGNLGLEYYSVKYTAGRRKQHKNSDDGAITHTAKDAVEILLFSKSIKNDPSSEFFEDLA